MAYTNIAYSHITDPVLNKVFRHADAFLHDCYGMFQLPVKGHAEGGACNFSIVLILLCVIDGMAAEVYPTRRVGDQQKRFKKLIRDKLYWGPAGRVWIDKGEAANLLYLEYRNPLVHELGQEKTSRVRRRDFGEPVIGKWGEIPAAHQNIDQIDGLARWNNDWPTMHVQAGGGEKQMKLCSAALCWSVKQMVRDLAADSTVINDAQTFRRAAGLVAPRGWLVDLIRRLCCK